MASNSDQLLRGLANGIRSSAEKAGKTLTGVLLEILEALSTGEIQDGKILIGSNEAGGNVTFTVPPDHTPRELIKMYQATLDWCNEHADPDNPPRFARRVKRLRVSFNKATAD